MKRDNAIKNKSTEFAVRIVKMVKYLVRSLPFAEHPICTQLLKSGTSIGANVRESINAQSKMDFINKMNIALKEANETEYWLELLYESDIIDKKQFESIYDDCSKLSAILTKIIKTTKANN